jgi:VanZ family protein
MVLIFGLSSVQDPPDLPGGLGDKSGHTLLYAGLGALMARAIGGGLGQPITLAAVGRSVVWTTGYGVTDEVHQRFVPTRQMDLTDLMADAIGAVVGAVAVYAWGIISRRHGL